MLAHVDDPRRPMSQVVGSSAELGNWNADDAPALQWSEGDVWNVMLQLTPGDYEFKVGMVLLCVCCKMLKCVLPELIA